MSLLDILSGGMSALDLPGSMVRDTLGGRNPLDQLLHPFSHSQRGLSLSGSDLLGEYGMDEGLGRSVGGFGAEVALDPLTYVGAGALLRLLKGGKAAKGAAKANSDLIDAIRGTSVVDDSGRPLRVHHGTGSDFQNFDAAAATERSRTPAGGSAATLGTDEALEKQQFYDSLANYMENPNAPQDGPITWSGGPSQSLADAIAKPTFVKPDDAYAAMGLSRGNAQSDLARMMDEGQILDRRPTTRAELPDDATELQRRLQDPQALRDMGLSQSDIDRMRADLDELDAPFKQVPGLTPGHMEWLKKQGKSPLDGPDALDEVKQRPFPHEVSSDLPSGYERTPNSLLGFNKHGQGKGFDKSNFPFVLEVEVTFPDGTRFRDAVKGMNKKHALERAKRNWGKDATVIGRKDQGEMSGIEYLMDQHEPMSELLKAIQKMPPGWGRF